MCSMISSQCDELRERATALRQGRWADGEDDAKLMEQAADTILELREMAQKANAENVKLRELAGLLLYGMCHDAPPHEVLLWSQKVNRLTDELGIEVDG